jgi:hypothetical protein
VETTPAVLKRAEVLRVAKQAREAKAWYRRVAAIPLKTEQVELAKKRLNE